MIKVEMFYGIGEASNSYLVTETSTNESILIDPSTYNKTVKNFLENTHLLGIFLTHGHFDHFEKLTEILKDYPVKVYLHEQALVKLKNAELSFATGFGCQDTIDLKENQICFIKGNDTFQIGSISGKVFYLPGHTNCSIGILIDDQMFIGDTLFYDSVGRWDLPTGNYLALMESIKKIKKLDPLIHIYPGHDEDFLLSDAYKVNQYLK